MAPVQNWDWQEIQDRQIDAEECQEQQQWGQAVLHDAHCGLSDANRPAQFHDRNPSREQTAQGQVNGHRRIQRVIRGHLPSFPRRFRLELQFEWMHVQPQDDGQRPAWVEFRCQDYHTILLVFHQCQPDLPQG